MSDSERGAAPERGGARLTFLGTGTSFGIPVIGCRCATCTSSDPRDSRGRHGAVLSLPEGNLLIDTPPELRVQLLSAGIDSVSAVWFTHLHADHLHGIDDLRVFTERSGTDLPAYLHEEAIPEMEDRFPYIFDPAIHVPEGTSRPRIRLHPLREERSVSILGDTFLPLRAPHGPISVFGFRVGRLGYLTDAESVPESVVEALGGIDVLVLNALWWGNPHPTHMNIEEAIEVSRRVGARRTYLTHLTHRVRHGELTKALPEGVLPAHDGLVVRIDG